MVSLLYISTVALLWLDILFTAPFSSSVTANQRPDYFILPPPSSPAVEDLPWDSRWRTTSHWGDTHRENKIWELTFYDWIFVRSPVLEFSFNNFFIDVTQWHVFLFGALKNTSPFSPRRTIHTLDIFQREQTDVQFALLTKRHKFVFSWADTVHRSLGITIVQMSWTLYGPL